MLAISKARRLAVQDVEPHHESKKGVDVPNACVITEVGGCDGLGRRVLQPKPREQMHWRAQHM
jgi:hypothetical protein